MDTDLNWRFIDERQFSYAEALHLSGLQRGAFVGYVERDLFVPQFPQKRGGKRERRTYTGRDILRLTVIAEALRMGVQAPRISDFLLPVLDDYISDFTAGTKIVKEQTAKRFKVRAANEIEPRNEPVASSDAVVVLHGVGTIATAVDNPLKEFRPHGPYAYVVFDFAYLVKAKCVHLAAYLDERGESTDGMDLNAKLKIALKSGDLLAKVLANSDQNTTSKPHAPARRKSSKSLCGSREQ